LPDATRESTPEPEPVEPPTAVLPVADPSAGSPVTPIRRETEPAVPVVKETRPTPVPKPATPSVAPAPEPEPERAEASSSSSSTFSTGRWEWNADTGEWVQIAEAGRSEAEKSS
jgi:hypothetical protein